MIRMFLAKPKHHASWLVNRVMRIRAVPVVSATVAGAALAATAILIAATSLSLRKPEGLSQLNTHHTRALILDRAGNPIRASYANEWNLHDQRQIDEVPTLVTKAILFSEDRRFYTHAGVDWQARAAAVLQNLKRARIVRGASTITEQTVRLLHPRPRSLWSKWLETWEAVWLEKLNTKSQILEFYLNQVPFAGQRRGVAQAAWFYFDRDLATLSEAEMLALAVLIRQPARTKPPREAVQRLATDMEQAGLLDQEQVTRIGSLPVAIARTSSPVRAPYFVDFLERQELHGDVVRTTLDPRLQESAQGLLDEFLRREGRYHLDNGAVILLDHQTNEVLAWAVARAKERGTAYNAGLVPRQPGSSMKPFLYALAFDSGYTASSVIEDSPLQTGVGHGLHEFRNYSRVYYGKVTAREALANSLNIPAVKVLMTVGRQKFLEVLGRMGISSLDKPADHYGDGLALGNGEVSLWEMVQAYAVLARSGVREPVRAVAGPASPLRSRVFSEEAATLAGHILSDRHARRLEFARAGSMEFPLQTAVKTGTSTDHRDAWAFAYNYKYVVGVWMGNLDNERTKGLTGVGGPVMVARGLMNEVTRHEITQPLKLSAKLKKIGGEYYMPGSQPETVIDPERGVPFKIVKPTEGLNMAVDPRVPHELQAYAFEVLKAGEGLVDWYVDGERVGSTLGPRWLWKLERGTHRVAAVQKLGGREYRDERRFIVK